METEVAFPGIELFDCRFFDISPAEARGKVETFASHANTCMYSFGLVLEAWIPHSAKSWRLPVRWLKQGPAEEHLPQVSYISLQGAGWTKKSLQVG